MTPQEMKTHAEFVNLFVEMMRECHDFAVVLGSFVAIAERRGHGTVAEIWKKALKESQEMTKSWKFSCDWSGLFSTGWDKTNVDESFHEALDGAVKRAREAVESERKIVDIMGDAR